MSATVSAKEAEPTLTLREKRVIRGAAVGQFVEWYDFLAYATLAPILALNFFPAGNSSLAILSTLAVYGAGFFMRPLGGMVCGRFGDRLGRRNILAMTVLLMGGSTLVCGLLPTYATAGVAAPVILLLLRLIQGFAAGGEASSMGPLVLESAPKAKRGAWIAIAFAASYVPSAFAGFFVIGLDSVFGSDAAVQWVWRIPFLFGGVLAFVGFVIRSKVAESEEFVALADKGKLAKKPFKEATAHHKKAMVLVCLIISALAVSAYTINSYMFTYLVNTIGMAQVPATTSTSISVIFIVLTLPYCGKLADRYGRKPLMITGAVFLAVTAYPAYLLCSVGTFSAALGAQVILSAGVCLLGGGGYVTLYELFPTSVRSSGIGFAYNLGYAVFGGTVPFVNQLLVDVTGYALAPSFYLIVVSIVEILVLRIVPETLGSDLKKSLFTSGRTARS
ncbi:MFS transporter [Amycolatopsis rhabdoformis]|uniref:MFS transporter n=1 Tax=Amycolatopsis rhabdoformis TaxID=1448059 RepID=A0ABZ1IKN2_9PSEU|nr:MFS transporter [Amycolatopsis rhabdoformis]WSE34745.1 MFS transporter [Amycolatopsis rhabdoformis]